MLKLSVEDIIEKINRKETFEAEVHDGSFYIKIDRYVPYLGTAIHNGNNLREDLLDKVALDDFERWYEEDPYTKEFISVLPIVLVGKDSRFEYDLNRRPESAIYKEAWGKNVWKKKLTKDQIETSLKKHKNYYRVTYALVEKLEGVFDGCIVYDMHSYNYKRWDRETPLFNIGSEKIDPRFDNYIQDWQVQLSNIEIDHCMNKTAINDVFYGRGYNLEFITENFKNTLVLATEVKKVYCDEDSGEIFPQVIKSLKEQIKKAILVNANFFISDLTNWKYKKKSMLLPQNLERDLIKIDKQLYQLVKNFEILNFVNPTNVEKEKKKFFNGHFSENPNFKYRPIEIDPFNLKRKLHSLEIEKINDISIQNMYEATINGYIDKIDMLASLGTDRFLYNSLRYFGKPSNMDINNAKYILHLPSIQDESAVGKKYKAQDVVNAFKESLDAYGFDAKISISKKIVSDVLVLNRQRKILVKQDVNLKTKELKYLTHHEIGVHMVTTMNSIKQPLKIFNIGLPVNTCTQEGLAVLSEYLSGNITLDRLRKLAFRVLAIDLMCNGADFKSTFKVLSNDYKLDKDLAFTITTRAYRGGGFTKDYLYLRGFAEMYNFWKEDRYLEPLLIGKTSIDYYNTIVEMTDRGLINKPEFVTKSFASPELRDENYILDYIVSGIR